jgi:hypothetical protein
MKVEVRVHGAEVEVRVHGTEVCTEGLQDVHCTL